MEIWKDPTFVSCGDGSREGDGIAGRDVDAVDRGIEHAAVSMVSSKVEE